MGQYLSWDAYPSADLAELECGGELGVFKAAVPHTEPGAVAITQHALPNSTLWLCTHGLPTDLKLADHSHVRVQFHRGGVGASWVDGQLVPVMRGQACISSSSVETDFCQDFQQVVWRVPRQVLIQKLTAQGGTPMLRDINFEPALDLTRPQGALVLQLLECLIATLALGVGADALVAELEQALLTAFLAASSHDRSRVDANRSGAAPWQVRRVESYIEENWRKPITIEDLVEATGASARTIFRAFQQSRDYTPLEFAKRLKLLNARRMLERGRESDCVTDIAFACGFSDPGRFSKDFVQAFGERPSIVLNRRRAVRRKSGDGRAGEVARATIP